MTRREWILQRNVAMRRISSRNAMDWTCRRLNNPVVPTGKSRLPDGQSRDHDDKATAGEVSFELLPRRDMTRRRWQGICTLLIRKLGCRLMSWLFRPVDYPLDVRRLL